MNVQLSSAALAVILMAGVMTHASAQQPAFTGVVRGVVLECDTSITRGEFSVRTPGTNQVYRFTFDSRTYVERESRRVTMNAVQKGDSIEIVADRDESEPVHYARTVHVIEVRPAPSRRPMSAGRSRLYRSPTELFLPRGNLTYAGVIAKLTPERMVVRTRQAGEKIIVLRRDTRYMESGSIVEAADLKPNTRVFVRAGKNLDDEIEAYQIIWGEILKPHSDQ
jgi:hypothetical protein